MNEYIIVHACQESYSFNELLAGYVFLNVIICLTRWETLWSGLSQQKEAEKKYRTFSPPLKEIDYSTKLVIVINSCIATTTY